MPMRARRLSLIALATSSFAVLAGSPPVLANEAGNLLMNQINGLITPLHGNFDASKPVTSLPANALQNIGIDDNKDNIRFNLSGGVNDSFSVGTETQISASSSASTTPDYVATVNSRLSVAGTSFNQFLGFTDSNSTSSQLNSEFIQTAEFTAEQRATEEVSSRFRQNSDSYHGSYWGYYWYGGSWQQVETRDEFETLKEEVYSQAYAETFNQTYNSLQATNRTSGIISGEFTRTQDMLQNNVTLGGIGANNSISSQDGSVFEAILVPTSSVEAVPSNTASAQASAAGSVSTNASASSITSQFVSAFATAF